MESLTSSFSDISIQEDIPQRARLTGIPRKIKDNCIDLHGLVQKWKGLTTEGYEKLKQISNCLIDEISEKDDITGTVLQTSNEILSADDDDSYEFSIAEELTQKLNSIVEQMEATVGGMMKIVQKFKSIVELVSFQMAQENDSKPQSVIFFQTLPVKKFYEAAQQITNAHIEELKLKTGIVNEIPRLNDKYAVKINSLYWACEPCITSEMEISLKDILVECCCEIKF